LFPKPGGIHALTKILTDSIENYLKAIYELTENGEAASTTALAARLAVAPPSVTGMVQNLAALKPPLVAYRKHRGVTLTAAGRRSALRVIRHHRLIETWLVRTLGYGWDEVHEEAERLEHVISEDMEARIARALGEPQRDPHGDAIPSSGLVMPQDKSVPLSSLRAGEGATVRRVQSHDPALLRHLDELGLIPGRRVTALTISPFDRVMQLHVQGQSKAYTLGPAVADAVFVEAA
jgi:DtxR family Mn-dependent transcriptional regulator